MVRNSHMAKDWVYELIVGFTTVLGLCRSRLLFACMVTMLPITVFAEPRVAYIPVIEVSLAPKSDIRSVDVYQPNEHFKRPVSVLGALIAESDGTQNAEQLVDAARARAAALGADLVMVAKVTTWDQIKSDPDYPSFSRLLPAASTAAMDNGNSSTIVFTVGAYKKSALGVTWEPATLKQSRRFVINGFSSNSLAPTAGLRVKDEILEVNGLSIRDKRTGRVLLEAPVGTTLALRVQRGNDQLDFAVRTVEPILDASTAGTDSTTRTAPRSATSPHWIVSETTDQFSDKRQSHAQYVSADVSQPGTVLVACNGDGRFLALVVFGSYLGDKLINVEYRFNKQPATRAQWLPSADGTGVLVPEERDFARQLASGEVLNIRAWDFRGVPYTLSVPLTDAKEPVERVLRNCHVDVDPIRTNPALASVDKVVILDIERWGPHEVRLTKQALTKLGFYSGVVDDQKDTPLYVAVQSFHNDFIKRCDAGHIGGAVCGSRRTMRSIGNTDYQPPISSEIYEQAPSQVRAELGAIKTGD